MKHAPVQTKSTRQGASVSLRRPTDGLSGRAIAPPTYGIEFIDRQHMDSEAAPNQQKNHTGLPNHLKAGLETLSGLSLDDVHVHYNSSKPVALQALAYTQGTNIHVGPGQEKHLPHEAWHVVQQKQGRVKPTMQLKDGVAANDDEGLEHEANVMGAEALHFSRPDPATTETVAPAATMVQQLGDTTEAPDVQSETPETFGRKARLNFLSADQAAGQETVQCKFGFEIELPILLSYYDTGQYYDPAERPQPAQHIAWSATEFDAKIDHYTDELLKDQLEKLPGRIHEKWKNFPNGESIVELASKPWDEATLSETDVGDKMQTLVDEADLLLTQSHNLKALYNRTGQYYIAANRPTATPTTDLYGNIQVTSGVQLSRVPEFFEWQGNTRQTSDAMAQILRRSKTEAAAIVLELKTHHGLLDSERPQLEGLLALLVNYLIGFKELPGSGGLAKNRIGALFYKTDLGELRTQLTTTAGAGKYIADHKAEIQQQLLTKTGYSGATEIEQWVKQWLDDVLDGREDAFLKVALNQWSTKLGPDPLGPTSAQEIGPVIEDRRLDLQVKPDKSPQRFKKENWVELAKTIYRQLKVINQIP